MRYFLDMWRSETGESAENKRGSGYALEQLAQKSVASHTKAIEGTITKEVVVYSESLPGGPGGQVLCRVQNGTRVRVMRLDSIYGNVQVKTQDGITGSISADEVNY